MVVLVTAETLILVLLSLLVAGLLRSHAEILRRLGVADETRPSASGSSAGAASLSMDERDVPAPSRNGARAPAIAGLTLSGEPVQIAPGGANGSALVVFLSSGCATCRGFWEAFQPEVRQPVPGGARLILVTRDSSHESPSRLRELAPPDLPLVMSSLAWEAYEVPLTPYFVYVDGSTGRIAGEGAAEAWPQIASLVRDALGDADADAARRARARPTNTNGKGMNGDGRRRRADDELRAAGIGPGHPSLYEPGDPGSR